MKEYNFYVYIITNRPYGVFYTGVTNDLIRRMYEHKQGLLEGFSKTYNLKTLVFYEHHTDIEHAIHREKRIKRWPREYRINIIQNMNPEWKDLSAELGVVWDEIPA